MFKEGSAIFHQFRACQKEKLYLPAIFMDYYLTLKNKCCVLCNCKKLYTISSQVRDSTKHKVLRCSKCGHVQLYPIPSLKEDKKFYDEDLQNKNINYYGTIKDHWRKSVDDTVRRVEMVSGITPKNGKILEIGSGHGFFLEKMRQEGFDIIGIEISKEKRTMAKKVTKAQILDIDINTQMPRVGYFDTIVMFHVLEHIANPINFLYRIKKLLRPRGKIVVEVPNRNDFQLGSNVAYREFYWQRAHIHYFTPRILKKILTCVGFKTKILGVQRYSIENMFSWRLTNKPQLDDPAYNLPKEFEWIEKPYKEYLEKRMKCDTLVAIGTNSAMMKSPR